MMVYQKDYVFVVFEDHTFSLFNIQKLFEASPIYQELNPDEKIYKPYQHDYARLKFDQQPIERKERPSNYYLSSEMMSKLEK